MVKEGWAIDTTAGRPILVYNGCSVIEDVQAYQILGLLGAVQKFREAFVIAVGDKSPFAKCALAELDAALNPTSVDCKEDDEALQRRHDQERAEYFKDEPGLSE